MWTNVPNREQGRFASIAAATSGAATGAYATKATGSVRTTSESPVTAIGHLKRTRMRKLLANLK